MRSGFFKDTDIFPEDLQAFAAGLMTDGVLLDVTDALQVVPVSGMKVAIKAGGIWIKGAYGIIEQTEEITIPTADGVLGQIHRIVMRRDNTNNKITREIISGTKAASPVAPALTDNGTIKEYSVATITIPAGTTTITAAMITDNRGDAALCPTACARTGILAVIAGLAAKTYVDDNFLTLVSAANGDKTINANKLKGIAINELTGNGVIAKVNSAIKVLDTSVLLLSVSGSITTGGVKNYTFVGGDFNKYLVTFESTLFGFGSISFEVARGETITQTVSIVQSTSPVYTQTTKFSVNIDTNGTSVILTDIATTSSPTPGYADMHFNLKIKGAI